MKLITLFFILLLISCNGDDQTSVDCSLVNCLVETFLIEIVDADGNNLIENGTYSRNDIGVYRDGVLVGKVYENQAAYNNLILFSLSSGQGNVDFEIVLSPEETDSLTLGLVINRVFECCPPDYEVSSAIYNGESQTVLEGPFTGTQKITVTK